MISSLRLIPGFAVMPCLCPMSPAWRKPYRSHDQIPASLDSNAAIPVRSDWISTRINLYSCNGTVASPILVRGNWLRGGGPSLSGGGINLGDGGGTYQHMVDNVLVRPGMYGIAISGGQHMLMENNRVYSPCVPNVSGFGMIVADQYAGSAGPFEDITVRDNRVNVTDSDSQRADWWIPDVSSIDVFTNNAYDASLSEAILPPKILGRL